MESIYLFFVVALIILAAFDLVVGVGNDAVNFLNSAIGSKVASYKVILFIAALGVLLGATFSSGMMEIARSGVFNPDQFSFSEIMVIFLAVMITDIILLDSFNTFGLPTSTTVSIIFELLGAAVAVALFKIYYTPDSIQFLGNYINSARALGIISGILLSVVIAFSVGAIVQFLSRLLFTFNFERNIPYFGAIWGSMAITSILYFIMVKGARGASFMTAELISWINDNTTFILLGCFVFCLVVGQLLISLLRVNIFRIIVLIGTFSIAMAFAGNDLVNFIGVPLAGYESFRLFSANPGLDHNTMTMESLLLPVQTPTYLLLLAGIIMVLALFFSRKARSVTETEVDLARQGEGSERFPSSLFSRMLVRQAVRAGKFTRRVIPDAVMEKIDARFDQSLYKRRKRMRKDDASFDQLRASVNMFVASILIALATSMKLPLSTTYVTFMVAMGTSLSDQAWGRESAVYRITGVMTVIGGWFFTAFTAFSGAFIFAWLIRWGGLPATLIALALAFLVVLRTYYLHKTRSRKRLEETTRQQRSWSGQQVLAECHQNVVKTMQSVNELYTAVLQGFIAEDRLKVKKASREVDNLNAYTKELKRDVFYTLKRLEDDSIDTGHFYVQTLDYLREISHCLTFITDPVLEHLENHHPTVIAQQQAALLELDKSVSGLFQQIEGMLEFGDFSQLEQIISQQNLIIEELENIKKLQVKFIKDEKVHTRSSILLFNLLAETKNLLLNTVNLLKAQRDFLSGE